MTPADVLGQCQQTGVVIGMDDQGLYVRGDREAVNRLLPTIKAHKAELLALLADHARPPTTATTATEGQPLAVHRPHPHGREAGHSSPRHSPR